MMRPLMFAVAFAVLAGPALAQSTSPDDVDRLKRMLDEKLGSGARTRSIAKPDKPLKEDDFHSIKRDQNPEPKQPAPGKRSSLDGARPLPSALLGIAPAQAGEDGIVLAQSDQPRRGAQRLQAKRDSYVILLKADITSQQLDAAVATLSSKYNLEITRHTKLGELHVSPRGEPGAKSLGTAPRTLGSALEPKVIKDLRNEPFVDAAYVDFLVTPKAVPRRVDTTVKSGAVTHTWNWRTGEANDGNWGLKLMRMPAVWTILHRARKIDPDRPRTRMAFLDVGFGAHGHLAYNEVLGGMPPNPALADCTFSHGTHVAGIAGAFHGKGRGIDGIVPDSKIDAIPVSSEVWFEAANLGLTRLVLQRAVLFTGAIDSLTDFIDQNPLKPGEKRVVNVSLGYNWSALGFEFGKDAEEDENIKAHIFATSRSVQRLAAKYRESILIVAAAGNDSEGLPTPHWAEFATPFAFAATHVSPTYQKSTNILIVEAIDRNGALASFSNAGGHISAPGVDIMSTLAGVSDAYGLCSGTSQATPHVTALAAILFELDPKKTPVEIIEVIRSSGIPGPKGAAPRVDALAAVLRLSKDNLKHLADLNGDGKVDSADLEIFKTHLFILEEARRTGKPIEIDLNGDGNIDDDERCWPLIDFNGSGKASYVDADALPVGGQARTDLQLLEDVWTDTTKTFRAATSEVGLDQLIAQWKSAQGPGALVASTPAAPQGTGAMVTNATSASRMPCH